ncbi:MAG: glycosyltransferase family 117 protein, partial [Longimicrobiales bacterium]
MSARPRIASFERALFGLLLHAYPDRLRADHASEMRAVFASMHARASQDGFIARAVLWLRIIGDTVRSAPVEQWRARRERAAEAAVRGKPAPDYAGAVVASLGVFLLYWITLAPTTAFWDAGEYITVGHVLGIPHPPGNPLFVMLARVWELLLAPVGWAVAERINLLSASCSALAHLFLFLTIERSLRPADRAMRRVGGACAVLLSATAFTVWHQSNVNEKVYTISLLTTMIVLWLALHWRDTRNTKLLVLAGYVTMLSATNHLMGVLVAPAVLLFVYRVDRRVLLSRRLWAMTLPLVLVALSAQLFLPLRAAQRPVVNESDPTCASLGSAAASIYTNGARGCPALSATLRREQYQKPSILRDPNSPESPRGARLIASQFVNYAQYFDWQWARSVAGKSPLFGGARPLISLLVLLLIAAGARMHWRADRSAALMHGTAVATLSLALVLYLNFKWGYSIARDAFPDPELHEVRERDYFFLIGFSLWGAWAGLGIAALWRTAA